MINFILAIGDKDSFPKFVKTLNQFKDVITNLGYKIDLPGGLQSYHPSKRDKISIYDVSIVITDDNKTLRSFFMP